MTFLSTKIWSVVLRSRLKRACSSLSISSTASCSLVIVILPMTFAGTDNNVIPCQLPQPVRFPLLGKLNYQTTIPILRHFLCLPHRANRSSRTHKVVSMSAFSSSVVIVSIPAALPFFMFFRACFISGLVIHSSLISISFGCLSLTTAGTTGSGWSRTFSKCSCHLYPMIASSVVNAFHPGLSPCSFSWPVVA